ncbi:MAG: hypothetical protein U0164_23255 [Gemmatimonadaceae bacterium]
MGSGTGDEERETGVPTSQGDGGGALGGTRVGRARGMVMRG